MSVVYRITYPNGKIYIGQDWASLDISDTFDRCNDAIGGVVWEEGDLQPSSNVRR